MGRIWNLVSVRAGLAGAVGGGLTLFGTAAAMATSVLLPPGSGCQWPATTAATEPDLAGVVRYDALVPFMITDLLGNVQCAGNLQNRVVKSKLTGRYHFYYRIRDTWGDGAITSITTSDFSGQTLRVAFRTDGLGTVPAHIVSRSSSPGGSVSFIGVSVNCHEHNESLFFLIKTTATTAHDGGVTRIDAFNGGEVSVPTVQP